MENPTQRRNLRKLKKRLQSGTDVALSMTKRLLQDEGDNSNLVFSPLLIHVLLSLIAAASTGPTLNHLLSFLNTESLDKLNLAASRIATVVLTDVPHSYGACISYACGAWVDQSLSLNHSFKHLLLNTYKATLHQPDFRNKADEVVKEVNSWVEEHTKGQIRNIVSQGSIPTSTNLILANAIYFKGVWANQFFPFQTKDQPFYLLDRASVQVPFMTSSKKQYIAAYHDFKVLKMKYKNGTDARHFSMCIFLPNAKDGLPSLIEKLDSQPGFIDRHVPRKVVKVGEFKVPKFKFSYRVEASGVLRKLGLVLDGEGNLSQVVDCSSSLMLGAGIVHKAFVEVNEKGTEAVAAKIYLAAGCSMSPPPKLNRIDFVADHPFLFVIREEVTRTLLFVGQVLNPKINSE